MCLKAYYIDWKTDVLSLCAMELQAVGPGLEPLRRNEEDESDGNELYYSLHEDYTSDDNESFYSVEDQEVASIEGNELFDDEDRVDETFVVEPNGPDADTGEVGSGSTHTLEEGDLYDFFNDDDQAARLRNSFTAKKALSVIKKPIPSHVPACSPLVIELRDESCDVVKIASSEPLNPERSPSVMMMGSGKCDHSVGQNSRPDSIEVIELNDLIEKCDQVPDSVTDDIEVTGSHVSLAREEAFVEFDGTKRVIMILSDDEVECDYDNDTNRPTDVADCMRKRERSPDGYEPSKEELLQSPVQRKMKKLLELAQRTEKVPGTKDDSMPEVKNQDISCRFPSQTMGD